MEHSFTNALLADTLYQLHPLSPQGDSGGPMMYETRNNGGQVQIDLIGECVRVSACSNRLLAIG